MIILKEDQSFEKEMCFHNDCRFCHECIQRFKERKKKKTQHLLPKFKIDIFSCVIVASVQNKVFQFWKLLSIHFKCRKEFKRWL